MLRLYRSLQTYLAFKLQPMKPLITVVGATGTGKSKLAVDLAVRFNGEIINGDAMQMYSGLPITTNQIPVDEREGIPHHLISCINLGQETLKVGQFQKYCLKTIEEIRSRGKLPILVGGTHYYTQSVLFHEQLVDHGNAEGEDTSEAYDHAAENLKWPILGASTHEMLQKLREVDPVMGNYWHPNERRKIRRSLQIYLQTGKPASEVYKEQKSLLKQRFSESKELNDSDDEIGGQTGHLRFPSLLFWVHSDKEVLRERLDSRVDAMVDQGLMDEARQMSEFLRQQESIGVQIDRTRGVWVSIGFKELDPYLRALSSGQETPEQLQRIKNDCIESVKAATRQYSRSQVKWIQNKLWNSLESTNATDLLYILDSTDVDDWQSAVRSPAEKITEAFLAGAPHPHPSELSEIAKKIFDAKKEKSRPSNDNWELKREVCATCNVAGMTKPQLEVHLKGRRHKNAVRSAERRVQRDEYFKRILETRNDHDQE